MKILRDFDGGVKEKAALERAAFSPKILYFCAVIVFDLL